MHRLRNHISAFLLGLGLLMLSGTARADLNSDLQTLNGQAAQLEQFLQGTVIATDDLCAPLNQANAMARDLINGITALDTSLAAPLQVDAATYDALDALVDTGLGIANEAVRLSVDLQTLSTTAEMITLKDGIAAMLQLSTEIGTMADRIGLMADNILIMSDNIGLMADRILATQQLQNQNVALTTESILQTQTNLLGLVSVVESRTYDLALTDLVTEGGLLAARMESVMLSPWTMGSQLRGVADDVHTFLGEVRTLHDALVNDSTANTIYVGGDTLVQFGNLSLMLTSLGSAVDGYVIAIEGLQPMTSTATLSDAMGSMLRLSGDIGIMSNRILEMADQILVMSDNIGLQADQILLTQQSMNMNVATTQGAILAAQELAIGIIAARNL